MSEAATRELDPEAVRIGATIRALREAYGLSRTELAKGVKTRRGRATRRYIQYIEDGQKPASVPICRQVADMLGVPLAAITVAGYEAIRTDDPGTEMSDGTAA